MSTKYIFKIGLQNSTSESSEISVAQPILKVMRCKLWKPMESDCHLLPKDSGTGNPTHHLERKSISRRKRTLQNKILIFFSLQDHATLMQFPWSSTNCEIVISIWNKFNVPMCHSFPPRNWKIKNEISISIFPKKKVNLISFPRILSFFNLPKQHKMNF